MGQRDCDLRKLATMACIHRLLTSHTAHHIALSTRPSHNGNDKHKIARQVSDAITYTSTGTPPEWP
jgi:hypothetical protein